MGSFPETYNAKIYPVKSLSGPVKTGVESVLIVTVPAGSVMVLLTFLIGLIKGNDSVLYLFRPHRFNMVSYSPQSRRLAVGAKNGQLALYDLRSSRCQVKKFCYKLT